MHLQQAHALRSGTAQCVQAAREGFMPKIRSCEVSTVLYLRDDAKLDLAAEVSGSSQKRGHQQRGVLVEVGPQRQERGPHDLDAHYRHKQNQAQGRAALLVLLTVVERDGLCAVTQPC